MEVNIFEDVKAMIRIEDVMKAILGDPAKSSGSNYYWFSQTHDERTPSISVNIEKQIVTDFSDEKFGKDGMDIFDCIVALNNNENSRLKGKVVSKAEINKFDALKWLVKEFNLDVDINSYTKSPSTKKSKSNSKTITKYKLEVSEGKHIPDNGIYAMFDTQGFKQKPQNFAGTIKERIQNLEAALYTLEQIKNQLITGHTCIPAGIKSKKDWVDGENFYQVFMVDIDNVATVDGEKQKYMVDDEQHVTVDKIVEYCNSINLPPTFIYYTFSHSEQQHKFRLVYILDIATSDRKKVEGIYDFLKETFKEHNMDKKPTDISSLFFGGQSIAYESDKYYDIICEEVDTDEDESEDNDIEYTEAEKECNEFLKHTQYEARNRHLGYITKNDNFAHISNFVPFCTEKIHYINGNDNITKYEMSCVLLDKPEIKLPSLLIDANGYAKCNYIMGSAWDKHCIVSAGNGNSEKLREVMQHISRQTMDEKKIYTHTGFRRINNKLCYLYHNGIIGDAENVETDLSSDKLERYKFTDKTFDLIKTIKRSLSFLDLADYSITMPLIATIYLAPLKSMMSEQDILADFMLFIQGQSGTRKSSMTAAAISHFGKFNRDTFACSFRDTINSIEKKAFILKDTINVIDDYNPETVGSKKLDILEKLFGTYGDRAGRSRMSQDGQTLKSPYIARGLAIVTGEMLPEVAQSRIARALLVTVKRDSINLKKLSEIQQNIEELSYCMKNYIKWIIDNESAVTEYIKKAFYDNRNTKVPNKGEHGRTTEIGDILAIGFTLFTLFAYKQGAINENEKNRLDNTFVEVLNSLIEEQTREVANLKPTELFYEALEQLITTHTITVKNLRLRPPALDVDTDNKMAGYYDPQNQRYYLYPDVVYNAVAKFYANSGSAKFPVNKNTLWRYMAEEGYLRQNDEKRFKVAKNICGKKEYVIDIQAREIKESEITDTVGLEPACQPKANQAHPTFNHFYRPEGF